MKIYVDARCLQDESYSFRGVGYHSSTLIRSGRQQLPLETTFVGLTSGALPPIPGEYTNLFDETQDWSTATFAEQHCVFLQLSPMTHSPGVCNRLLDRSGILAASLIYDFIPLDTPERYLASPENLHSYTECMLWLNSYKLFFPISQYSQDRLLATVDCDPACSHVTGVTLRTAFEEIYGDTSVEPIQSAIDLPTQKAYYLFVGGADPRKNIDVVLKAHAQEKATTDLVVVGHYPKSFRSQINKVYQSAGGKKSSLIFRQDISDDQLAHWYRGSVATICSSHIEGFSLPVIESIACGAPTIVSDIDAHRELVEDPEHRFPPSDADALSALMKRVLDDSEFRESMRESQRSVPGRFLDAEVGKKLWQPIAKGMVRLNANKNHGWFSADNSESKKSLAILSPFPPDRSGIADYTLRTIEALSEHVDVDVFTDCENPVASASVRQFQAIGDWAYASGEYDRVLSVVGNSHFHTKIIELQQTYGGPCLVHDNRLAELYNWWKGPEYFRQMSSRSFSREVSNAEAQAWIQSPGTLPGIFFDEIIESANPLLVHSAGIQQQVAKQYGKSAIHLPFSCYRSFDPQELTSAEKNNARDDLGMSRDAIVVVTLGIVSTTKGPKQCIDAATAARRSGLPVELFFVGSSEGARKMLEKHASACGISSAIHFSGDWVSDADYRKYIIAADYAIQLRNHFFGGLSGAMLDCIASGLPTIANDDLAEAMDSPEYVLRVGDSLTSEEVSDALLAGINAGLHTNRNHPARAQYLRKHSFERYALALLDSLGLSPNAIQPQHADQAA